MNDIKISKLEDNIVIETYNDITDVNSLISSVSLYYKLVSYKFDDTNVTIMFSSNILVIADYQNYYYGINNDVFVTDGEQPTQDKILEFVSVLLAMDLFQSIPTGSVTGLTNPVDFLQFNTSAIITNTEGKLYWNSEYGTLNLGMVGGNVILQVGQEQQLPSRPRNVESVEQPNGSVVYIYGANGSVPHTKFADALSTNNTAEKTIAMSTETIDANARGYYTTFGIVRDLDTLAFEEGDSLWLSTTPGQYTNIKPTKPNHQVLIGFCLRKHGTAGSILFAPRVIPHFVDLCDVDINTNTIENGDMFYYDTVSKTFKSTPFIKYDNVLNQAYFGDKTGGNYTAIESDGTIVNKGTSAVYDDLLPTSVTLGTGANAPSYTNFSGNFKAYEFLGTGSTVDEMHMGFQFSHKWEEGSPVRFHLHLYIPDNVAGGTIKMYCDYSIDNVDDTGAVTPTTISGTIVRTANQGIAKNMIMSFGDITMTNKTISTIFTCRFYRDPADAADTFGASVWLRSADIHYKSDTLGSRDVLDK